MSTLTGAVRTIWTNRTRRRASRPGHRHGWRYPHEEGHVATHGVYRLAMVTSPDVRKANFAAFVKRAIRTAEARGWSVPRIAKEAGIGSNTIYRWRDGDWKEGPKRDQLEAFCGALGIPVSQALAILSPDGDDKPADTPPAPLDPDLQTLLRVLADPATPQADRDFIQESLRMLAARADGISKTRTGRRQKTS